MGTITCRNAKAPVVAECVIQNETIQLTDSGVQVTWQSTVNGALTESLGTLCYRVDGTSEWSTATSIFNGSGNGTAGVHSASLTNLAPGSYNWQVKANVNGTTCESAIASFVIEDDVVVEPPTDCCFVGTGTSVAFEAESAEELGANWIVSTSNSGYNGAGHLVYDQPTLTINPDHNDAIKYVFSVATSGSYMLHMRNSGVYDTAGDKNNDVWITHNAADVGGQTATANIWKKVFRSFANPPGWNWTIAIDPNEGGGFYWMQLEAGVKYCLTIAGRSGQFHIDTIALLLDNQGAPDNIPTVACTGGTTGGGGTDPEPTKTLPSTSLYTPGTDLIALHYDVAPDLDDLQALAAGCSLSKCFDISPAVVIGTYGLVDHPTFGNLQGQYLGNDYLGQAPSYQGTQTRELLAQAVASAAYGSTYVSTGSSWTGAVTVQANKWRPVLAAGGCVYVAEGGPSDFTADVLRELQNTGTPSAQLANVKVFQHSTGASSFNEGYTTPSELAYVQSVATYTGIDNGNVGSNGTADLEEDVSFDSSAFKAWAQSSACGAAWTAALDRFSAKVDFSDAVEYLHILGIGTGTVANITDFCDYVD